MVTEQDVKKVVKGIAAKYALGRDGLKFNEQEFEDYKQELYVKVYEILHEQPDCSLNYLATSMWHRAGDIMRSINRDNRNMTRYPIQENVATHLDEQDTWQHHEVVTMIQRESSLQTQNDHEEFTTRELIQHVLNKIADQPADVRSYVIAKLKLNGYIPMRMYPEVKVDLQQFDKTQDTAHYKILTEVLNMPNAESGGLSTFKKNKQNLFKQLTKDFDLTNVYKKWFYITYRDSQNELKVKRLKAYSIADVESQAMTPRKMQNIKEIISISTED